jgi:hypothetical protein
MMRGRDALETRRGWMMLAVATAGVAMLCGCAKPAQPPAASVQPPPAAAPAAEQPPEMQQVEGEMFKLWVKTQHRFSSAADAQAKLPFKLKMPDSALVPSPTVIYVEIGKARPRVATVQFGVTPHDINMTANRSKMKPNPEVIVEQGRDDAAKGYSRADATFEYIQVNSLPGYGVEPGVNTAGPARFRLRPGVVSWWDHGVHYELHGTRGPAGTPLAELVRIAESMR